MFGKSTIYWHMSKDQQTHYRKLATEYYLAEHGLCDEATEHRQRRDMQRFDDMLAMRNDLKMTEGDADERSAILNAINSNKFEVNNFENFYRSYSKHNTHGSSLSGYSATDFQRMRTYKVVDADAGFAITSGDDIVSVHNNTGVGNIGDVLVKAAIRAGGTRLDHYDGFLTGFYRRLGFRVRSVVQWNDDFVRADWPYEPIDIEDDDRSVYAKEWKRGPQRGTAEWDEKAKQYRDGEPDVIYRKL